MGENVVVEPGGGSAVEQALREVSPGRYDAYEALLRAVGESQVWMLLWHGEAGRPDAQYGNMEVGGFGYAPCVTSPEQLAASGWSRAWQVSTSPVAEWGCPGPTCAGSPAAWTGCRPDRW